MTVVCTRAALLVSAVALLSPFARADLKIVSQVTITGLSDGERPVPPQAISVFYKGSRIRTETGARVTIEDCAADKQFTLNPKSKTYTVTPRSANDENLSPLIKLLTFRTEADVTPTGETQIIAGLAAKKWTYQATIRMGAKGADDPVAAKMFPAFVLAGEQWVTDAVKLPAECAENADGNAVRLPPRLTQLLSGGLKTLADKLAQIKGTPLSSRLTVSVQRAADAPPSPIALPSKPVVTTVAVQDVSTAELPDDLFGVPADYKRETEE